MAELSKERLGEIALKLVKAHAMKRELPAPEDFRRDVGSAAKEIGEDTDTLIVFVEAIMPELIGKMLGRKSVSLKTSN